MLTLNSTSFNLLYEEYSHQKPIQKEYLSALVLYFPALVVSASDGNVDTEEWFFIEHLATFIVRAFKNRMQNETEKESLNVEIIEHIRFIIKDINHWETLFLMALAEDIRQLPSLKNDIIEIIEIFAESSEGISEVEAAKIAYIDAFLTAHALLDAEGNILILEEENLQEENKPENNSLNENTIVFPQTTELSSLHHSSDENSSVENRDEKMP